MQIVYFQGDDYRQHEITFVINIEWLLRIVDYH